MACNQSATAIASSAAPGETEDADMTTKSTTDVEVAPPLHILKSGLVADTEAVEPHREQDDERYRHDFLSGFTADDDRRIMRKVDLRFLPLVGFMYLVKQVDYTNAASIKVLQVGQSSNVLTELGMTADQYNWIQTVYFISYVIFEVPSNLVLKKVTPRKWQTRIFLSWGIVVACHAAVQNKEGFYALRFLLGMMEAGFFPGLAAQMCDLAPERRVRPANNVDVCIPELLRYHRVAAHVWYIVYGWSAGVKRVEMEYLKLRLPKNAPRTHDPVFSKDEILASIKDPKIIGFTLSQVQPLLAAPHDNDVPGLRRPPPQPAAVTVLGIIGAASFLRRAVIVRPLFIQLLTAGTLAFFIVLCLPVSRSATYAACVLGTAFYFTYFVPFWAWRSATLTGSTGTAFTLALQTSVAQVGGVIAPQVLPSKWAADGYKKSFIVCSACVAAAAASNAWLWYLTRASEKEVQRVRRLRIEAERAGRVWAGADVRISEEPIRST
ncbi:hypothetical protein SLS63_004418 [Diaporthe eres]|uniref:Major facilitator superfamily transporter n=1 Tax=Diaporthe eres TaxID=83184 RepID=A0ABR1PDT7_DIAER